MAAVALPELARGYGQLPHTRSTGNPHIQPMVLRPMSVHACGNEAIMPAVELLVAVPGYMTPECELGASRKSAALERTFKQESYDRSRATPAAHIRQLEC